MSFLADWQLRDRTRLPNGDPQRLVITPWSEPTPLELENRISWGLSSYGYDLRCGDRYLIFSDILGLVVDPLTIASELKERLANNKYVEHRGPDCIIPPGSFALAESLEYLEIPRDCIGIVLGKSTYARCGITLNMTPLEPEWRGVVTLEIGNLTRLPAKIHSNQGIGQVLFAKGDAVCQVSYNDKKRSCYQDQKGLTLPLVG